MTTVTHRESIFIHINYVIHVLLIHNMYNAPPKHTDAALTENILCRKWIYTEPCVLTLSLSLSVSVCLCLSVCLSLSLSLCLCLSALSLSHTLFFFFLLFFFSFFLLNLLRTRRSSLSVFTVTRKSKLYLRRFEIEQFAFVKRKMQSFCKPSSLSSDG